MAKPIFLVGLPYHEVDGIDQNEYIYNLQSTLDQCLPDYYTLIYFQGKTTDADFRVIYEKDFDEVKFEELKEMVRGSMIPSQQ